MLKKIHIALIILAMVLVVSCAQKPAPSAPAAEPGVTVPAETTGEAPVDQVAEDISDAADTNGKLDTSGLDDVDGILADIENI